MKEFIDILDKEYRENWDMKRQNDDVEVYIENVKELISYRYPNVKDILELVECEKGCIKEGNALDGRGVSIALKVCKNIESRIKGQYPQGDK